METRSAKRKRLLIAEQEEAHRYTGEDRISELSDDVIHRILSLLPTKTIVRMSILSRRWRLIWSSFPDLDFSSTPQFAKPVGKRVVDILDFISHVLVSHNKRSDIRSLRFSADLTFTRLNHLIKQAVRRNVQELDLEISTKDSFNLTRSVVSCKSLRVLKLKSRRSGFRLPPSTIMKGGFQALHTLSFSKIVFDGPCSSLLDLFSETSFPLLKKLKLDYCVGLKSLRLACRGIVDITLENCIKLIDLSIFCCKLERLTVRTCFDRDIGSVKIDAPLLRMFVWETNGFVESSFVEKLTCLDEASIGLWFIDASNNLRVSKASSFANLLCGISCSRYVQLDNLCFRMLMTKTDSTSILPYSFGNLEKMELKIGFDKKQIPILASLLTISPSLHTLIINIQSDRKSEIKEWDKEWCDRFVSEEELYWEWKIQGLNAFVHNVKVVKINANNEYPLVLCLAKFLNKYGIFLQEMTLSVKNSYARERLKSQFNRFVLEKVSASNSKSKNILIS